MHQHRRLGVPVRLRADVDAGDDNVDLAAVLGEFDDLLQGRRHPVHVLGTGLHRHPGACGQCVPFQRDVPLLGQFQRRDHPAAFLLGQRAESLRRVTEQHHTRDALRILLGGGGHQAGDDRGLVQAPGPVHRNQGAVVGQVVFGEIAQQIDQLVGVHVAAGRGTQHLLPVGVDGFDRFTDRGVVVDDGVTGRVEAQMDGSLDQFTRLLVGAAADDQDLLQTGAHGRGQHPVGDGLQFVAGRGDRRPHVQGQTVGAVPGGRRTPRVGPADRIQTGGDGALRRRVDEKVVGLVAERGEVADLCERDQSIVRRVLLGDRAEQVDLLVVGGPQACQIELVQPLHLHALCDMWVQAPDQPVLGEPRQRRPEGEMVVHDSAADPGDRRRDALQLFGNRARGHDLVQRRHHLVEGRGLTFPAQVDVGDDGHRTR